MKIGSVVIIPGGQDTGPVEETVAVVSYVEVTPTFTAAGELAGTRTRYFAETGGCSAGRIGVWVNASGKPLAHPVEPEVLPWGSGAHSK